MTFKVSPYSQNQSYPPQEDRQLAAILAQAGVAGAADLLCSAGTGFNSNIAAGRGLVTNSYQTQGGLYVVRNDSPVSVLHPTPDPALPRIDQIYVKVFDSVDGGDSTDSIPQAFVLPGTPTAGATLTNNNGMATYPFVGINNYLRLSRVLVPNAAASAASFTYADARAIVSPSSGLASALPGYEIGYDQITAGLNISSTTEATGTTVITCGSHTFDGSPVMAEFFSPNARASITANDLLVVSLFEGATQIGRLGSVTSPSSSLASAIPFTGRLRFTPTAGAHTYSITAFVGTPNGFVQAGLGGTGAYAPAFVRFTKV